MQVKQRLQINVAVSVITAFALALMLSVTVYRVKRATEESKIANEILSDAFERNAFRSDYLRNNNERARVQWFATHERIGRLLRSASEKFRDTEDKVIIDEMIKDNESSGKLFMAIVENREKTASDAGSVVLYREIENRLVSQLNMRLYDRVLHIRDLGEAAARSLFSTLRLAAWGIICLLVVVTAAAIFNAWTMGRTISIRIRKLQDGASVIGDGNLDHKIEIKGDDEFAHLSKAFNAMTAKLRESYLNLENEIAGHKRAEEDIKKLNKELKRNVDELEGANKEMEAFIYSVAHDLRAPLRSITGFSDFLLQQYSDKLDDKGKKYLNWVADGGAKMNQTIEDLLQLSRISRHEVHSQDVDISKAARSIIAELRQSQPDRRVTLDIKEGITAHADARLIEVALSNLLGNAWKFTSKTENACIEFGTIEREGKTVYYVKDNGAGFDQSFAGRLFLPFQRLHSEQVFEGTGIGLAIVERVIRRHGGEIWAEGKTNAGAVFFFTLNSRLRHSPQKAQAS